MLPPKYVKRAAVGAAIVLALSLLALAVLDIFVFFGGDSLETEDGADAVYYRGSADFGVVLCAQEHAERWALLNLFRSFDASVILSDAVSPSAFGDGGVTIRHLTDQLTERSALPPERILVVGAGKSAPIALGRSFALMPTLGVALVRPIVDPNALLNEGVYSCGVSSNPLFLIAPAAESTGMDAQYVELYNLLAADSIVSNGRPLQAKRGQVALRLSPAAISGDAALPAALLDDLSDWVCTVSGRNASLLPLASIQSTLWALAAIALLVVLLSLSLLCRASYRGANGVVAAQVKNRFLFFLSRAVLWPASLPAMGIVYWIFSLSGVPLQTGGRLFLSYTVGCALTTGVLYRRGMLGIVGQPDDIKPALTAGGLLSAAGVLGTVLLTGGVLVFTGSWHIEASSARLVLFLALWIALSIGWVSMMRDALLLWEAAHAEEAVVVLLLIPYLPLAGLCMFGILMGLWPVATALLRMFAVLVVSILTAKIERELTGSTLLGAIIGAFPLALFAAFQTAL